LFGQLRFRHKVFIAAAWHDDAEAAVGDVELDWRNVISILPAKVEYLRPSVRLESRARLLHAGKKPGRKR